MELDDLQDDDVTNDLLEHVIDDDRAEESGTFGVMWIVLDILIVICVLVNILLLVTVFSSRKLRCGAMAGLVITLTISNILHVVGNRVIPEFQIIHQMELAGEIACKVSNSLIFIYFQAHGLTHCMGHRSD